MIYYSNGKPLFGDENPQREMLEVYAVEFIPPMGSEWQTMRMPPVRLAFAQQLAASLDEAKDVRIVTRTHDGKKLVLPQRKLDAPAKPL